MKRLFATTLRTHFFLVILITTFDLFVPRLVHQQLITKRFSKEKYLFKVRKKRFLNIFGPIESHGMISGQHLII